MAAGSESPDSGVQAADEDSEELRIQEHARRPAGPAQETAALRRQTESDANLADVLERVVHREARERAEEQAAFGPPGEETEEARMQGKEIQKCSLEALASAVTAVTAAPLHN